MQTNIFRRAVFAAGIAIAASAVLAAGSRDAVAANAAVTISNFAFAPGSVTVNVGDTVTFTNSQAGVPHTASSDTAGVFDSGNMSSGATFTTPAFTAAGTVTYHCNIHPDMQGTIIVQGAQAATPTTAAPTATTAAATATTAASPTATTAAATATTAAATPTTAAASPTTATGSTAPAGTATAALTPAPPATGDEDGDGGSNTGLIVLLVIGAIAVIGGGGAWAMMRRNGAA